MASEEDQPDTISRARFDQLLQEYPAIIKSVSDAKNSRLAAGAVEKTKQLHMVTSSTAPPNQKTLVELDKFRYDEAVATFGSRTPQRAMGHDDVKALVEWKLSAFISPRVLPPAPRTNIGQAPWQVPAHPDEAGLVQRQRLRRRDDI